MDEVVGADHSALGVAPAQKRLEPDDSLVGEIDQRLVVKLELIAGERMAQVPFDRHPFQETLPQRGVERLVASTAELFGAVHGSLGVSQQLLGSLAAVFADGHADARCED